MSECDGEPRTVHVLFFSVLQDSVGGEKELEWKLAPETETVAALLAELYARWPELESWDAQIRVAVNFEYVGREHELRDGQEVAIMPPVQGG